MDKITCLPFGAPLIALSRLTSHPAGYVIAIHCSYLEFLSPPVDAEGTVGGHGNTLRPSVHQSGRPSVCPLAR